MSLVLGSFISSATVCISSARKRQYAVTRDIDGPQLRWEHRHQDERSPFHMRSLVSSQRISDCNCQLCISNVIVVPETTILLNFCAGTLALEFPNCTPESGH
jgi:hypothetical protein